MAHISLTKESFLWWMTFVYFCAFASIYFQIPGLYGDDGILPVSLYLKSVPSQKSLLAYFSAKPTLIWLAPVLGCQCSEMMELISLVGILISLFVMGSPRSSNKLHFLLLWIFYFSIYQVGQTFLHFQWDILLLEAGFLALLVAPFKLPFVRFSFDTPHDGVTMWLVKWLFFRLMFASGVVKLTSQCSTWWGLTALSYHFESQCLPTAFSWLFHHLPDWFLKQSVIATFIIEIPIPFLFFSPIRSLRIFSFWAQILLQTLIILTGNYNFFNILTLTLAISLLDDRFIANRSVKFSSEIKNTEHKKGVVVQLVSKIIYLLIKLVTLVEVVWLISKAFSIQIAKDGSFSAKIGFSPEQFSTAVNYAVLASIWIGAISFGAQVCCSLKLSIQRKGITSKVKSTFSTIVVSSIAIFMFCISIVPHTYVDDASHRSVWPIVQKWHDDLQSLELVHSYGLFRRMTGVGGRPEIVIEGSNSVSGGWKEYEFQYKPGNESIAPNFVAPHQPRLDWQMWFAALGTYHHNPWFVNLVHRLLENKMDVVHLLSHNPFQDEPPQYIRAILYTYEYTPIGDAKNRKWWRRKDAKEYLPVLNRDNPSLKEYLKHAGLESVEKQKTYLSNISILLELIRGMLSSMKASYFIWTVSTLAIISRYFSKI